MYQAHGTEGNWEINLIFSRGGLVSDVVSFLSVVCVTFSFL
jgi:hypothetical protein